MQRQQHIDDLPEDNSLAKIVAALLTVAIMVGGTAYIVYGSSLNQPQVHHTDQ